MLARLGQALYWAAFLSAALALAACGDDPPKPHYTLLEVISLKGTCKEDHATKPGDYAGRIVRWVRDDTGTVSTYGSVLLPFSAERVMYDVLHPAEYQPPDVISFDDIRLDTTQNHWTLHGISDSRSKGDGEVDTDPGYDSTCELDVTERGNKLPDFPELEDPKSGH